MSETENCPNCSKEQYYLNKFGQKILHHDPGSLECVSNQIKDVLDILQNRLVQVEAENERLREKRNIFKPCWPDGLQMGKIYTFPCDDKGRDGGCWLRVIVAEDGDVHLSMQEWEDIRSDGSKPMPIPSVRCRTHIGGGRFGRTRQALLWLAKAIDMDREELGLNEEAAKAEGEAQP